MSSIVGTADDHDKPESETRRRLLRGAVATGAGYAARSALLGVPLAADIQETLHYEVMPARDTPPANIAHTVHEAYLNMALALAGWHSIDDGIDISKEPLPLSIKDKKHEFICVQPGDGTAGDGKSNVSCWCDDTTGAKIFALREKMEDGSLSNELRVIALGRNRHPGELYGTNVQDVTTTVDLIDGKRSPQIAAVDRYYDEVLKPYIDANPGLELHLFGESQGSGNALHLKYRLQRDYAGPAPETTLFEPFAPTQEVINILKDSCGEYSGDCPDGQKKHALALLKDLRRNTTSIRSIPATAPARCVNGASSVNNKQFAEHVLLLDATLDPNHKIATVRAGEAAGMGAALTVPVALHFADRHRMTRRRLIKDVFNTATALAIGDAVGSKAVVTTDMSNHTLDRPLEILGKFGEEALARPKDITPYSASDEEILSPSKYKPTDLVNIGVSKAFSGYQKHVLAEQANATLVEASLSR